MDDLTARYLRQQMELGGAEVVMPEGGGAARRPGGRRRAETAPSAPTDVAPLAEATGASEATAAASPSPAPERPTAPALARWRDGAPPVPGPGLTVELPPADLIGDELGRLGTLDEVAARVAGCERCELCRGRTRTVPGEGNPRARLMLVGEGPGATEDETGRPFVGAAGQLLDKILEAIECPRETVFIANIVKCRPPQNRKPLPDEMAACLPYLRRQIALVRPAVLVALGSTAAEGLLGVKKALGELRGKVHRYDGIPLVVTYHPAALLRNPNWKKPTWDDVRIARQLLGD